ncbi:GDP-mannose 4,6-dehydratase [Chitinophaga barathri]|uniref:NAD-dependent epimerase/dehydratase family protein n=1 Tax=Chitinophaga barathri TaxID=1647451 RepID=A0A3N4MFP8_9BACT|nr:GDP-mannose 4,6-dehydratase [Chitinophaga barathri]RPD40497.1 NAD-dependent epimerase/dehydratase family protein [Chitinophaga barathri]
MKYLITGGCGFIGSNLAAEVLKRGEELIILDNLWRHGGAQNLDWLRGKGQFIHLPYDIRNYNDVEVAINTYKPDYIFHLAGQVAMTTSIQNPRLDFEVNAIGTHNLLEAVRKYSPTSVILYSSTNKVYGDFSDLTFEETNTRYVCKEYPYGFPESLTLEFHSPYGCSKGAADQYLLDYSRIFGIKTIVFRHSSMYGSNQHATFDQGWVGWFCQKALEIKKRTSTEPFTISGSGKQVRDVLYASDVVSLYFVAKDIKAAYGQAFNIGGGISNSLSLLELFALLEKMLGIQMSYTKLNWRESDQKVFVADITKALALLPWKPAVDKKDGIESVLNWLSVKVI